MKVLQFTSYSVSTILDKCALIISTAYLYPWDLQQSRKYFPTSKVLQCLAQVKIKQKIMQNSECPFLGLNVYPSAILKGCLFLLVCLFVINKESLKDNVGRWCLSTKQ